MSGFHFYRWNELKLIPLTCTLSTRNAVQETYPKIFSDVCTRLHGMRHNDDGLSGRGLVTSLREGKDRSFNKITGNWVTTQFPVSLLNDLSYE